MRATLTALSWGLLATGALAAPLTVSDHNNGVDDKPKQVVLAPAEDSEESTELDYDMTSGLIKLMDLKSPKTLKPVTFRLDILSSNKDCGRPNILLQDNFLSPWENVWPHPKDVNWDEYYNMGYIKDVAGTVQPMEWKFDCNKENHETSPSMKGTFTLKNAFPGTANPDYTFRLSYSAVGHPTVHYTSSNVEYQNCDETKQDEEWTCPEREWKDEMEDEENWEDLSDEEKAQKAQNLESTVEYFELQIEKFHKLIPNLQTKIQKLKGEEAPKSEETPKETEYEKPEPTYEDKIFNVIITTFGVLCAALGLVSLTGICVLRQLLRRRRDAKGNCLDRNARRLQRRERRRLRREKRKAFKSSVTGLLAHFGFRYRVEEQQQLPTHEDTPVKVEYKDEKAAMYLEDENSEDDSMPRSSVEDELAGLRSVADLVSDLVGGRPRRASQTDSLPPYSDYENGRPPSYHDDVE